MRSHFSADRLECDFYFLRSLNHEMYLQLVQKSTLSQSDDERFYKGNIKRKPWNYYYGVVVKVKEKIEKSRLVKNNDEFKKYVRNRKNC